MRLKALSDDGTSCTCSSTKKEAYVIKHRQNIIIRMISVSENKGQC